MASAARDMRYRNYSSGYVDGSLAHDLDWAVRERELRHAGEAPRHQERETVRETPKVKERPRVQVREKQHVSVVNLLGMGAVIAMAVLMLMSYIQLTVLAADTVELKTELETLESENVRLTAQYEQMFDLATVKESAEAAGMVKPSASQIGYIDLSEGDSVIVYRREDPSVLAKVLTSVHHSVYTVVEYFD